MSGRQKLVPLSDARVRRGMVVLVHSGQPGPRKAWVMSDQGPFLLVNRYYDRPHLTERVPRSSVYAAPKKWRVGKPYASIKARKRSRELKSTYSIDLDAYRDMLFMQRGRCPLCDMRITVSLRKGGVRRAVVDHCHVTLRVRGLLCGFCNRALHPAEKHGLGWIIRSARYLRGRWHGHFRAIDMDYVMKNIGAIQLPDDKIYKAHTASIPDDASPCACDECEAARLVPLRDRLHDWVARDR